VNFIPDWSTKQMLHLQKVNTIYLQKGFKFNLHQKPKRCLKMFVLETDVDVKRICVVQLVCSGPGSVVGIATAYGPDGPGIETWCGRDFPHLSRPALKPTHPVQWVPGLSRG
jgi:hypothetical protein